MDIKKRSKGISLLVLAALLVTLIMPGMAMAAVENPMIHPNGGTYDEDISVTISNIHSGSTAYYTTDGSDPRDVNDAEEYDGAFKVDESLTVKAAVYDGDEWSSVVAESYIIDSEEVAKPVISPKGGTYNSARTVTISNIKSGTTVYYTTDGSDPRDVNDAEEYDGAFKVNKSLTVKAAAYDGDDWSAVAAATYVIKGSDIVEKPVINPSGGTYKSARTVTISNIDSGSTCYYTTDGTNPTTSGTTEEYTGAFTVRENTVVKAASYDEEDGWSAVATASFVITSSDDEDDDEDYEDSDDLAKLKEKFAEAIRKNHMVQAAQILQRIKMLSTHNDVEDRINELKEQVIDAVNDNDWDEAESILKQIIKLEKSPWAYEQLGDIYELNGHKGVSVFSNGNELSFDVQPTIIGGRTMVPVRKIANALGISDDKVQWKQSGEVTINYNGDVIILNNNSKQVKFNGKKYDTDVPAQITNGRMLVPLRVVSEMFKKNVQWYPKGKIVSIT
ncbi:MAG: hypothetical protein HPY50_07585 [Firmicutes bacterium]|nr:hypothetical protein [Bacillota bacterium]